MDEDFNISLAPKEPTIEKDQDKSKSKDQDNNVKNMNPEHVDDALEGRFAQSKKNAAQGMTPIMQKMERYFEEYELGVYEEAQGDKGGAVWKVNQSEKTPGYLKAMNAQGRHIFVRPSFEKEAHFMLHDDLDKNGLNKYHKENGKFKPGRMVVESSPGNYQVWIKSERPLSIEEKTHWLNKMDSDPGASPKHRWGRCPGFRNRKQKYQTEKGYPLAKTVWIDWKNQAQIPKVELQKESVPRQAVSSQAPKYDKTIPSGQLPTRADFYKGPGKESEQDFSYAMSLLRRKVPRHEVEQRILNERTEWSNHKGEKRKADYVKRTLDNAETKISNTPSYENKRATKESGRDKTKEEKSDYKITVKDVKNDKSKYVTLKAIPNKDAKQILSRDAKKAVANMGYTGQDKDNLQVSVEKLHEKPKAMVVDKSMNMEQPR